MAKLNIFVCDLCNYIQYEDIVIFKLILQQGFGKNKETNRGYICKKCYDDLTVKLSAEVKFKNQIYPTKTITPAAKTRDGTSSKDKCLHEHNSFEPPFVVCRDCGEKWDAGGG